MQLCYRGNTYCHSNQRLDLVDSVTMARFMGQAYITYNSKSNLSAPFVLYQYRGITYIKPTPQLEKK